MTSDIRSTPSTDAPADACPSAQGEPDCLCCYHFALDLESVPEAKMTHRARSSKRKRLPAFVTATC